MVGERVILAAAGEEEHLVVPGELPQQGQGAGSAALIERDERVIEQQRRMLAPAQERNQGQPRSQVDEIHRAPAELRLGGFDPAVRLLRPDGQFQGLLLHGQLRVSPLGRNGEIPACPFLHHFAQRHLSQPPCLGQSGQGLLTDLVVATHHGERFLGLGQLLIPRRQLFGVGGQPFQVHGQLHLAALRLREKLLHLPDLALEPLHLERRHSLGRDLRRAQPLLQSEDVPAHGLPLLGDRLVFTAFPPAGEELGHLLAVPDEIAVALQPLLGVRHRRTPDVPQDGVELCADLRELALQGLPAALALLST